MQSAGDGWWTIGPLGCGAIFALHLTVTSSTHPCHGVSEPDMSRNDLDMEAYRTMRLSALEVSPKRLRATTRPFGYETPSFVRVLAHTEWS